MKKFAYYSDLVFCFFAVGLLTLCYLRYLKFPLFLSLILGAAFALAAALLLSFILSKKQNAVFLKRREAEEAEKLALHLALLQRKELAQFFHDRLQADTFVKNGECFGKTDGEIALFKFTPTPLQAESVLPLLYESGENAACLYCYELSESGEAFCKRFGVRTVKIPELFQKLQRENALPCEYKSERAFLKRKRRLIRLRFSKKSSLRFFTGGVMLLCFSLFTPFPYYYLITGGLLIACALFTRLFGSV